MESNLNGWNSFARVSISNASSIKRNSKSYVQRFFFEYCSNSSIHGVRYFSGKRHWTEKCWWIIAIGLSMWFCGLLIRNVWIKWRDNPVSMAMTENQSPISAVPFPTVTICPEIKTYRDKLDITYLHDFSKETRVLTKIELARMQALSHICVDAYMFDYDEEFANASIFDVFEEMAPILNSTLRWCTWKEYGDDDTCSQLFVPILTEEGLCFSFNALNSNETYTSKMDSEMMAIKDRPNVLDWNLENGYSTKAKDGNYPIRVFSAQKNSALNFKLRAFDVDVEYVCRTLVPGYKLFLHTPGDVLKASDISIRVPFSEEINISIKPKLITTSDGLREYRTKQRRCFFNSERRLHFFKFYSLGNCKTECLANYTLKMCGCVKFNMPRNESTKICGSAKIDCYRRAQETLFEEDIIDGLSNKKAESFRRKCYCLPSCTSITYEAHVDRAKFSWREALKRTLNWTSQEVNKYHMSSVFIYFDHYLMSSLKREEKYTRTDFLAVCGGLLGLCLGISALSIIECLYFFTLRLYWSLYQWKSKKTIKPTKPRHINHILIDMPKY